MKTATSVCAIQCRIAINVVGLVEFYGRLRLLFYWISFTVQLERTLES